MEALVDTPERQAIRDAVRALCERFGDDYWSEHDQTATFPSEFHKAVAEAGWLGIAMPEEYGGAGLGVTEASILMQTVANSGGTLDTTHLKTRAVRDGNRYIVHGRKMWTTTAQTAQKIVLLARTTPIEQCARPTEGLSLFYTDLNRNYVEVQRIRKMGRAAVDSNAVFIDGLPIPVEDRIGEEGKGFRYILDSLNPERIINAAETVGIGRRALAKATAYAKERIVFDRPIGQNQAIQHPLAESWAELLAAELLVLRAAQLYDSGQPCGAEANAAKYFGADAAFRACDRAVRTHGGMGYASEFHVERYFRESVATRLAPVSRELILCYLAERVLGLPKSY
jgi:acyl-CoA dehydrogenase